MAVIDVADGKASDAPATSTNGSTGDASKADPTLDATKETATRGDKTSSLGRVLVQMDSNALADDIADLVLGALKDHGVPGPWPVRIVDDPAALRAADVLALLRLRAKALDRAIDAALAVPAPGIGLDDADEELEPDAAFGVVVPPVVDAVVGAVAQSAGILSKLLAHDYQLSGREIDTAGLGFDLLVAHSLLAKHAKGVAVSVDRVLATDVAKSAIFTTISGLDDRVHTELTGAVTAAATEAAQAKAALAALTARREALHAEIVEMIKVAEHASSHLTIAHADLVALDERIDAATDRAARAEAAYDALAALAKEATDFVTEAATPPTDGKRAPLIEAARAELAPDDYVLYVRLLAAGMDEIVDLRVIRSDHWTGVSGATAEYALLQGGRVLAAGVRSALQTTRLDLGHPDHAKQDRILYMDVPTFKP